MTTTVKNFLGRELSIPEDRLYDPNEGLWLKEQPDGRLAVGLTEPSVLMAGAIRELEMLVADGSPVERGETVLLILTARLKYVAVPVAGKLEYSPDLNELSGGVGEDPYDGTIFFVTPETDDTPGLLDAAAYAESLKTSEGARNPGGHKGGVSPTCKAVYMGLGDQRIKTG
ncbi:GcvH-related protein [Thermodesulfobacteriota bacterium]